MIGLPGTRLAAIAGDFADAESMFALKGLMTALGSPNIDCRQDGAALDPKARASWLFNSTIAGIEKADAILIVGSNPRWEAPVLNARIRKRYLKGGLKVGVIGPKLDLTYPYQHLGQTADVLGQVASGAHAFADVLKNAKAPMLILGQGALRGPEGAAVLGLARKLADSCNLVREDWNGFNVLQTAASRVGGMEIGFVPQANGRDVAGILDGTAQGRDRGRLSARRRRDRHDQAGQGLRDLPGPSRRCRRAPRRRDPAGCRLSPRSRAST